jgi:hypothetical protein
MSRFSKAFTPKDEAKIVALHHHGLTTRALGERFSVSPQVISGVLHAHGIKPDCRRRDFAGMSGGGSKTLAHGMGRP